MIGELGLSNNRGRSFRGIQTDAEGARMKTMREEHDLTDNQRARATPNPELRSSYEQDTKNTVF